MLRYGFVNPSRQRHCVSVPGAGYDALVCLTGQVPADEVTPVERENSAPLCGGKREHSLIGGPTVPLPCFLYRQYVVTEVTQLLDDRMIEILVGVEARH
jgi:hypothetical protein